MHAHPLTHAPTYTRSTRMHTTDARIHPSRAQVLLSNMKLLPVLLLLLLLLLQVACWHAAAAAAGGMLARCNSCCCCMLLREIGLPLIITLASTPSRATQRNTSRGGSSFLFLPPFSLPARASSTASSNFLRAARNVIYFLLRASRSQGSPTTDISPGSPESTF
jgi:hypothetical protein